MGGWQDFLKIELSQLPTIVGVGSNAFSKSTLTRMLLDAKVCLFGWEGVRIDWKYRYPNLNLKLWLGLIHYFASPISFNDNHVFRPETFCWLDFLKTKLYQFQLQQGLGWMHFWCLLIELDNFALDKDAVLWPETTCLDGWWLDFPKT